MFKSPQPVVRQKPSAILQKDLPYVMPYGGGRKLNMLETLKAAKDGAWCLSNLQLDSIITTDRYHELPREAKEALHGNVVRTLTLLIKKKFTRPLGREITDHTQIFSRDAICYILPKEFGGEGNLVLAAELKSGNFEMKIGEAQTYVEIDAGAFVAFKYGEDNNQADEATLGIPGGMGGYGTCFFRLLHGFDNNMDAARIVGRAYSWGRDFPVEFGWQDEDCTCRIYTPAPDERLAFLVNSNRRNSSPA